jgi:hypothetical protein
MKITSPFSPLQGELLHTCVERGISKIHRIGGEVGFTFAADCGRWTAVVGIHRMVHTDGLFYQMQPIDQQKLGSTDEQGDSCHHRVAEGGAEGDHDKPDAYACHKT